MVPKASQTMKSIVVILVCTLLLAVFQIATANDAEILTDFQLPLNVKSVDANYFTFTGARSLVGAPPPSVFNELLANFENFPSLRGQGVSASILRYPGGGINPLHSHPRSAELFVLVSGNLQVGFIDTNNKFYNQTLQAGDLFLFPKGLVHFQWNFDLGNPAIAVSLYGSANAGIVSFPVNLFASGIGDGVLAQSFRTDVPTVQKIKAGFSKHRS